MVVNLQGVLVDGVNPNPVKVPPNTRQALEFAKGESVTIRLDVVNSADFPVAQTGSLVLTCKKRPYDIPAIFTVTGVWDTMLPGRALFEITPLATRLMEFGRYCYDIWLLRDDGANRNQIVALSPLQLYPSALT
jgi:hypothetical protein